MSYFSSLKILGVLLFVLLLALTDGHSQEPIRSKTIGSVHDANGARVSGARVVFTDARGRDVALATTDPNGSFELWLLAGSYTLKTTKQGFADREDRVVVESGRVVGIDLRLDVAENRATVTVTQDSNYLDNVSSASRSLASLRDTPQSISLLVRQQIADQGMAGLGDVARYQPGLTAHQGENNRDQIIMRGQSSSADFFINGIRDDVQYFRELYNLESVEVIRGPNALMFGRGGGGGVINRVTKEAMFAPLYSFSLMGGSFQNGRATFDLNSPISKRLAFRVNGMADSAASFRDEVKRHRLGFTPTITYVPDAKTNFRLTYEYGLDRRTADRGITSFNNRPAIVAPSTYYGNPADSHVRSDSHLIYGGFDRQFGKLSVRNRAMFGDYDRFYQNYVPGVVNAAATLVTLSAYNTSTRRRNIFGQSDLTYTVRSGRFAHTLLAGVEIGRQRTRNFRNTGYFDGTITTIQVPFDNPRTDVPVTFRQSPTDANNRVVVALASAFIQDQIEVSKYLWLLAGARFDQFDLRFTNDRNGQEFRRIDRVVSPRFGVVIKPVRSFSLYGSYTVSNLPSSGDQFASLNMETQTMKPERFANYEVGIKWDILSNLALTSALYRLDRTNTRSNDPNRPGVIVQTGSQRTNGFEMSLSGRLTARWAITGGYSFQDAFISSATIAAAAGKRVPQVPKHNFSVWNKYRIAGNFSAGLGLIGRTGVFAAIDNSVILPGYIRADGAAYYSLNERWRLQANIENLLNTRYFLNADNNTNISPGAPRSFKIGLTANF